MGRFFALLALLLAAFALRPAPALADAADIEAAARGVVRVVIIGRDGDEIFPISHGTGFAVGGERIITNAHVVAEALEDDRLTIGIVPAEGGDAVYARIVSVSQRNDLALLETTEPLHLPPLTIAGNPSTDSGAVTAIGYPMNVDRAQGLGQRDIFRAVPPVKATGFLSGRRPSREFDTLLHTASIGRGNSGGPLVDECGRVIGVNSFGAESGGSDAEFFFAVSTRELLPFLRANDVAPRLNSLPCRSIDELEEEEFERAERQREAEAERAAREEEALAQRTAEARRTSTYEVLQERSDRMMLTFVLLLIAAGGAGVAAFAHREKDMRLRAIGGGVALVALAGALVAWLTQPALSDIDTRVEEAIRSGMEAEQTGVIGTPALSEGGSYACVLDTQRSRVTGAPEADIAIEWSESGCVNQRSQYGLTGGRWTRVFVPANEAAVAVNRFDPDALEFVTERYLLDRDAMIGARSARGQYQAPACGAAEAEVLQFGSDQAAIMSALPPRPNERLVYRCGPEIGIGEDE